MAVTQKFSALQVMQDAPVIPVIVLNDVAHAVPMARALVAGGIRMLEVTCAHPLRWRVLKPLPKRCLKPSWAQVPCAPKPMHKRLPTPAPCLQSVPATPLQWGRRVAMQGLSLLPGVATGGEIMMAQEDGFTELKFFPAMQAGGPAMLKAWSGPFFDVKFCPTGGVTPQNAPEFLALPNVVCVGGSWLVPADAMAAGDWARITQLARDTASLKKA
jgi:2-dehydro-3-deoxyphosphogluconate aldolase/(4S)-4-hydroxy-2-oxoglutarate aldolase